MNVTIDQDIIRAAAQAAVEQAITAGLNNWDLRKAISEAATAALTEANVPALVAAEMQRQLSEVAPRLVEEAVRGSLPDISAAIGAQLTQGAVAMVAGLLEGRPANYDSTGQARWKRAEAMVTPSTEDER